MTGNLNFLNDVTSIGAVLVELPDEVFRVRKVQGNMHLGPNINLSNVLYIPSFHCNLVPIK